MSRFAAPTQSLLSPRLKPCYQQAVFSFGSRLGAARAVGLVVVMLLASHAADAQSPFGGKRGKALRLAGIIEPSSCNAAPCLGILKLQVDKTVRRLGVTMAQTDTDEGMTIFRGFALQSQNLRLLAPTATVQPFLDAAPGTMVRMWGLFKGLDLVVAQLTVETAAGGTPTVPAPP